MNNLLSYCGLIDARIRASDKDLPVHWNNQNPNWKKIIVIQKPTGKVRKAF